MARSIELPMSPELPNDREEQKPPEEHADDRMREELGTSATVGAYLGRLRSLLMEVARRDDGAQKRVAEVTSALGGIAGGHGNIAIEDLPLGMQGVARGVGTHNTAVGRAMLDPAYLSSRRGLGETEETFDHENSEETGHAGQTPGIRGVVGAGGTYHDPVEIYEGVVEAWQGREKRGDPRATRPKQPQKVYGDGQALIAREIGLPKAEKYVRKGGSEAGRPLQIEVWREQPDLPVEEMVAQGAMIGLDEKEVHRIARELGRDEGDGESLPKAA